MANIFKSEYIQTYAPTSSNNGNIVQRNGVSALCISPAPFWHGSDATSLVLTNEFSSGQYLFDIWMDTDDLYYSTGGYNVTGGITIYYTDETKKHLTTVGDISNPKGWQHVRTISDSTKTIEGIIIYYWTGTPVYYRYDSFITPISNNNITKKGLTKSGIFVEPIDKTMSILKGGSMKFSQFIEY